MPQTLKPNETFSCPHCGKQQEGVVDDYVIPNRLGAASATQEQCGWCDGAYEVEKRNESEYVLRKL